MLSLKGAWWKQRDKAEMIWEITLPFTTRNKVIRSTPQKFLCAEICRYGMFSKQLYYRADCCKYYRRYQNSVLHCDLKVLIKTAVRPVLSDTERRANSLWYIQEKVCHLIAC